jgi:hypothetical protein
MKPFKYSYDRYNRFDVMKVNLPSAASVLFLSRHVLAFLIIGFAFRRAHVSISDAFGGALEPIYMLSDIPALLVFLAMMARHPSSGRLVRFAWRMGPYLLLISAGGYLALLFREIGFDATHFGWAVWAMIFGTAVAVAYVLLSPYARDLFREFPDAALENDGSKKR